MAMAVFNQQVLLLGGKSAVAGTETVMLVVDAVSVDVV